MSNYLDDVLLDISSIRCQLPDGDIAPEQIELIAENMLRTRGTVQPLVVRKAGYDANGEEIYELVHGHLEYQSARRAMAMDATFEMIRAFVIEPDRDQQVLEQIQLLRRVNSAVPRHTPLPEEALKQILRSIETMQKRVNRDYENLIQQVRELLPVGPPDPHLTFLNQFLDQKDTTEIHAQLSFLKNRTLVTALISHHPFSDVKQLQAVRGLGMGKKYRELLKWLDEMNK
jgi:hypothetical protein